MNVLLKSPTRVWIQQKGKVMKLTKPDAQGGEYIYQLAEECCKASACDRTASTSANFTRYSPPTRVLLNPLSIYHVVLRLSWQNVFKLNWCQNKSSTACGNKRKLVSSHQGCLKIIKSVMTKWQASTVHGGGIGKNPIYPVNILYYLRANMLEINNYSKTTS